MTSGRQINAILFRYPLVPAATFLILGIASHPLLPVLPANWIAAIAMLIALGCVVRTRQLFASMVVAAAIFLSGVEAGQLFHFQYPRDHIGAFAADEPRLAWVEATIVDAPRLIEPPPAGRPLPDKQFLTVAVLKLRLSTGWASADGTMPVTISPPVPGLCAGQVVRMLGRIERPAPAMNPGGFDAAEHYRRERVLVSMHVSRSYDVQVLAPAARATPLLADMRQSCRDLLSLGFDVRHSPECALLEALVFGDRGPEMKDVQDDFVHTGTTHLLAANGSRVALLAGAIYLLCRLLRLAPRNSLVWLLVLIALFGFLTLPAAEAIRPVAACVALGIGVVFRRTASSLQALCLVAIAILMFRPMDLYGPGFQLSFTIVLGLILFAGPVMRWTQSLENEDRKVAERFQRPSAGRQIVRRAKRRAVGTIAMGLVAWLVAAPLVAFHFEQVNPWTVPFGMLLFPFATAALGAGFVKIALTAICPPLASTWAAVAAVPADMLTRTVHWMSAAPGSDIPLAPPPVGLIVLYYGLLLLPLLPLPSWKMKWCARCGPVSGCALLMIVALCGGIAPVGGSPSRGVRVTLLFVGAGQCAVVEPAGGGTVVFDAGSSSISDPLRTCIEPFLRHEQCRSIDALYLSHGDYDHISAARAMVPEYSVRTIFTSPYFRLHTKDSRPCKLLLDDLDHTGHAPRLIRVGDRFNLGTNVTVDVLWPPPTGNYNSNNAGLVLRLVCGNRSILFPADIQEPAERELLKHPEMLRSDILIAPHHGSAETTTRQFIAAVSPKFILASNDARLSTKQRKFDAEESARPIYRTSRCGAITIEIGRDGDIHVRPFLTAGPSPRPVALVRQAISSQRPTMFRLMPLLQPPRS